ncbi:MAG TPA: prepilin-type N-terminal cleavage/methylation domain-containing protein [Steroidobacteraceae bacterium]
MKQRGFTLVEIVVAIAIASVVVVFASIFIAAPISAYDAQSKRSALVTDLEAAWPRMREDLREALPNSLRVRRNGRYVVIEMLHVAAVSRYTGAMGNPFDAAGTVAGVFSNLGLNVNTTQYYLSVNNRGPGIPNADAYQLTGSITSTRPTVSYVTNPATGEASVSVMPAPVLAAGDSPHRRVYLVSGPVTYLCDESQGTLQRYSGYAIAGNHAARDAPNEFGGATTALVARGLTTCNFNVSPVSGTRAQTASVRLTATRSGGESVTLLHGVRGEYAP